MLVTIDPPPGIKRTGTAYQSKGRFYDANLWRWFAGTRGPIGGWVQHSTSSVIGAARAMRTWRANDASAWAAVGTDTGLYAMDRAGTVTDITPTGFTSGRVDAVYGAGYGAGLYGAGTYGTPRPSTYNILDASVWSLDTWGQDLVGVMPEDGKIYEWALNTASRAAAVANAPTCLAIVSTAEKTLMALGCNGDPRSIMNSDKGDNTTWTTSVTNYARAAVLQTSGKIVCGRRINAGTLIFTDVDVWLASFLGPPYIYGYTIAGTNCGIVSPQAAVVTSSVTFWMGRNGFFVYNGYAQPLESEVQDYVFNDINLVQSSKIWGAHNSSFGEVTWYYCSAAATEIDSYVTYNYREGHWNFGKLTRLCGADKGVFSYPMMVDGSGVVWDHENGWNHGGIQPYAQLAPLELGNGEYTYSIEQIIADHLFTGDVSVTFYAQLYPLRPGYTYGPYALTDLTDVRLTTRQVQLTYTGADNTEFRVGNLRLDCTRRGKR